MEARRGEERGYTEQATEDLLFNLWYLRSHVNGIQREMREGFAGLRQEMDARFEKVDARFEKVDARFEKVDAQFEKMEHRISWIFTFLGLGFTILAALITLFQFVD